MILIVCADDALGMMFNHRRQSRDRAVCADILKLTEGKKLWIKPYSAPLFSDAPDGAVTVAEDCLDHAGMGEYCFVEDCSAAPWAARVEQVILYRWNRRYPADLRFDIPLEPPCWRLAEQTDFAGNSHETITREVYTHET